MRRNAPPRSPGAPDILSVCLGLLAALLAVACAEEVQREVPTELVGRWVTDHPDYVGRSFEVTPSRVTIDSGVEPATTHTIVGVEEGAGERGHRHITLVYQNESGDRIRFPLTYDAESGRVWPRHQPTVVWQKSERRR